MEEWKKIRLGLGLRSPYGLWSEGYVKCRAPVRPGPHLAGLQPGGRVADPTKYLTIGRYRIVIVAINVVLSFD